MYKISLMEGSDNTNYVFSDVRAFVEFACEYSRVTKMGLVRDPFNKKHRTFKYQALMWKNGDILAVKTPNRADENGQYPLMIIAKGTEAVIELLEVEGF